MIKKISTKIVLLVSLIIIIYFSIFIIQSYSLEKSLVQNYNEGAKVSDYSDKLAFIRCNDNILDPEFATIFFIKEEGNMGFYKPNKIFWASEEDWSTSYTGGTTIKNTTFSELVTMVKEDCSQFQKGRGDYYGDELAWSYSLYEPEPEKTQEEIEYEKSTNLINEAMLQDRIDSGQTKTYSSYEEILRAEGATEDQIKEIVEEKGKIYQGL